MTDAAIDCAKQAAERSRDDYRKEYTNAVAEATREYDFNLKDTDEWEQNATKCVEIASRLIDLAKPNLFPDDLRVQLRKALMEKLCGILTHKVSFHFSPEAFNPFSQLIRRAMVGGTMDADAHKIGCVFVRVDYDENDPRVCVVDPIANIGQAVPYSRNSAVYHNGRWSTLFAYVPDLRIDA